MADIYTARQRSQLMSRVRSRDTAPERAVRSVLHRMGFRFRLHRKDLLGKPDIVLTRYRKAIFVHGCFWHQHPGCRRATVPATRRSWWRAKLKKNQQRDAGVIGPLVGLGWEPIVVWECETKNVDRLRQKLTLLVE